MRSYSTCCFYLLLMTGWSNVTSVAQNQPSTTAQTVTGFSTELPPETNAEHEKRLAEVEAIRARPAIVLVHRAMWQAAPENTLNGIAAAADYGADGVEIDVRRTADNVLICFHDDDMLDRLCDGYGSPAEMTYAQLCEIPLRGAEKCDSIRIPTLAACLAVIRERRLLAFLDIKEPGLEDGIAALLDAGNLWDQIVVISPWNSAGLLGNPQFRHLEWKPDAALYLGRRDMDPDLCRETIARNGQLIIVDDPRVCAQVRGIALQKRAHDFSTLRKDWPKHVGPAFQRDVDAAAQTILKNVEQVTRIANQAQLSTEQIARLERFVKDRSLHRDFRFCALDGALAARALGKFKSHEAVDGLIMAFKRIDPALDEMMTEIDKERKYAPTIKEFRLRSAILAALGELDTPVSREFLFWYLSLDREQQQPFGFSMDADATRALLKQDLSAAEYRRLVTHPRQEVRGTAILGGVDTPTETRRQVLAELAPWALELPSVGKPCD